MTRRRRGGLPGLFAHRNNCLQNGLKGKRKRGLRFLSFCDTSAVSFEIKIPVLHGLCRAAAPASNTQVNSKYYGKLARSSPQRVKPQPISSCARCSYCRRCRVTAACYFQIAAGPPAALSKRSWFSSSKMRTGELCLVVLSFEFASAWV
jgi:hypothetical protein